MWKRKVEAKGGNNCNEGDGGKGKGQQGRIGGGRMQKGKGIRGYEGRLYHSGRDGN